MTNHSKYFSRFTIDDIQFTVITSIDGIRHIVMNPNEKYSETDEMTQLEVNDPYMFNIHSQLTEYFNGDRKKFDLPLKLEGTEFQKKVWNELLKIPYGKTISYKDLAIKLGDEKVIRAAAHANGVNPLPIVIPCHRVVGSDGSLVGYGGGLHIKEKLLALEGSREPDLFHSK